MEIQTILSELKYKAVRSSGAGGQNVNKVSTKVELDFDVVNSTLLTDEQKQIILSKLFTHVICSVFQKLRIKILYLN